MKIKSLQLKNFKRFTHLTLQGIPEQAKLVLLIGSNGSGKSCVFDAFEVLSAANRSSAIPHEGMPVNTPAGIDLQHLSYYFKGKYDLRMGKYPVSEIEYTGYNNEYFKTEIVFSGVKIYEKRNIPANAFYGRSAIRYLPRLTRTSIGKTVTIEMDSDRPKFYIDEDKRFENDIDLLIKDVVEQVFKGINQNSKEQLDEIKIFLDKINQAFPRIFGNTNGTKLMFKSFSPPADGNPSRLIFQKGNSEIDYDLLSAGEKEIVNLLFNLFVRNKYYNNTVYFFDEIDAHLNTKLQYNLIKEITENWVPENCQFWTASHSLGFIQYAKESEQAVIFDFDDYDFDQPRTLTPEPKDNSSVYEIAVSTDLLPGLFQDRKIVFIENEDKDYYAAVNSKDYIFVKSKNRDSVFYKAKDGKFWGITDRDFLTDADIEVIENQYKTLKILRLYCIENYLFHPDNLEEYCRTNKRPFDKAAYIQRLIEEKNKITDSLAIKIATIRQGYPYFKEVENEKSVHRKRFMPDEANFSETQSVIANLRNDNITVFLKSMSLKDYGKSLPERANIKPSVLAKTNWFKQQIESIIK